MPLRKTRSSKAGMNRVKPRITSKRNLKRNQPTISNGDMAGKARFEVSKPGLQSLGTICDEGSSNAAKYLHQLTGVSFKLNTPWVAQFPIDGIAGLFGNPQEEAIGVHLHMAGDIKGALLFIFHGKAGHQFSAMLQHKKTSKTLSAMDKSALKEAGNVLANAYLNALADRMKLRLQDSVPRLGEGLLGGLVECALTPFISSAPSITLLKNSFYIPGKPLFGDVLILIDPVSETTLRRSLERCQKM